MVQKPARGFVTIATGNESYYRIARNLLRSYRMNSSRPLPFALIADRENQYTKEFDQDGVISSYKVGGWNANDAFTRGSNYAAAIHDPLKEKLLADQGLHAAGMNAEENMAAYHKLDQAVRDRLQEIEHIRWCRYHFLNSWKAPDGDIIVDEKKKAKDAARRLHSCLVPYAYLSEKDKEKDAYFFETLGLRLEKE